MNMKYKINLENLDYDDLTISQLKLINKHSNEELELLYHLPKYVYPYTLKLGNESLEFKEHEVIQIKK